jgi:hypothetical protein
MLESNWFHFVTLGGQYTYESKYFYFRPKFWFNCANTRAEMHLLLPFRVSHWFFGEYGSHQEAFFFRLTTRILPYLNSRLIPVLGCQSTDATFGTAPFSRNWLAITELIFQIFSQFYIEIQMLPDVMLINILCFTIGKHCLIFCFLVHLDFPTASMSALGA